MDNWLLTKDLPTHFVAAAGLVQKDDKVLLIRSERRGWEYPGGVVERGESILDGLKREILEESGIVAEPIALVGVYQNLALKKGYGPLEGMTLPPVVNFTFLCRYISGTPGASEESIEAGWFTPEEALSMVTYSPYNKTLADLLSFDGQLHFSTFEKTRSFELPAKFISDTLL